MIEPVHFNGRISRNDFTKGLRLGETSRLGQFTPIYLERASGDATAPKMEEAHGGVSDDARLTSYVGMVGRRVLADSKRKDYQHTFKVLSADKVVNAFALGNGNVYVTRGLLNLLDDEAELAFVLGHEVGHVEKRHIAHAIDEILGAQLLLAIASSLISDKRKGRQELLEKFGGTAANLVLLGFGRDRESEADERGLLHSAKTGYDPLASTRVFRVFQKLAPESKGVQVYLDSHPTATKRIKDVESDIRSAFPSATGVTNRARYNKIVKGLDVEPGAGDEPTPFYNRPEIVIPVGVAATALILLPILL